MAFFGSDWRTGQDDLDGPLFSRNWLEDDIGPFYYEHDRSEPDMPRQFNVDRSDYQPMSVTALKRELDQLTDEERMELFSHYCKHCGTKDIPCCCSNDE